jgi:hypothetical protein
VQQNPYRPPSAELVSDSRRAPRRLGWKVYFGFVALLTAIGVMVEGVAWMQPLDALSYSGALVSLCGLFGYAFSRRIGTFQFWRIWLLVALLFDVLYETLLTELGLANQIPGSEPLQPVEWVVIIPLILPVYFGLYLYGYRSPELWQDRAVA